MITNPEAAAIFFEAAFQAYVGMDRALGEIADQLTTEELARCKRATGRVMGESLLEVIEPILKVHPHLLPAGWKDSI
jgi:hypothetical protein